MADVLNIEINPRLASILLRFAQAQGRAPDVLVEEALLRYLGELGVEVELGSDIRVPRRRIYGEPLVSAGHPPEIPLAALFQLIDQGQRERGVEPLSEEEAMELASEELHAMRREGGAGRPQKVEQ